jgi:hypothetical protein
LSSSHQHAQKPFWFEKSFSVRIASEPVLDSRFEAFLHANVFTSPENAVAGGKTGRLFAGCRMSAARGNHNKPCGWTLGRRRAMIYSS